MKAILIILVQTNMAVVGQAEDYDNNIKDYSNKDCISCKEHSKVEFCFQCFERKSWDHSGYSI